MEFVVRCALRKENLPIIPCDCSQCDWYIRDVQNKNCFWVLAESLDCTTGGMSVDEIAEMEGISIEEAEALLEQALKKFRERCKSLEKA